MQPQSATDNYSYAEKNRIIEMLGLHQSMVDSVFCDIVQTLAEAIPNSSSLFSMQYFGKSIVHGFAGTTDSQLEKIIALLNNCALRSGKQIFTLESITEYAPSQQLPLDFFGVDIARYVGYTVQTPDGMPLGVIGWLTPSAVEFPAERYETLKRTGKIIESVLRYRTVAGIDPLTKLSNRAIFNDNLDIEWSRAQGDNSSIGILMIDVDHFKIINDSYGHAAGDACLQQIAKVLSANIKGEGSLIARYGGEEFIGIMPHTSEAALMEQAEKLRLSVEALSIPEVFNEAVTVSIGASILSSNESHPADCPEQAMQFADEALYRAKTRGRNQTLIHYPQGLALLPASAPPSRKTLSGNPKATNNIKPLPKAKNQKSRHNTINSAVSA